MRSPNWRAHMAYGSIAPGGFRQMQSKACAGGAARARRDWRAESPRRSAVAMRLRSRKRAGSRSHPLPNIVVRSWGRARRVPGFAREPLERVLRQPLLEPLDRIVARLEIGILDQCLVQRNGGLHPVAVDHELF